MSNARTMLTNVRSALSLTTKTWHELHHVSEKNRHAARESSDKFKKSLKNALSTIFQNPQSSALFKENLRSSSPKTYDLLQQYNKEKMEAQNWIHKHPLLVLEKKLERAMHDRNLNEEATKRTSPALHNHMYQIDELIREAIRTGIVAPSNTYEQNPEEWILYLDKIRLELDKEEERTLGWKKWFKKGSSIHDAARNIEKSTREGLPTMLSHVKQSLDLQRKIVEQFNKAVKTVAETEQDIKKLESFQQRLGELDNLGESGYLLAHAKEPLHLKSLVNALDGESNGANIQQYLRLSILYQQRQSVIDLTLASMSGWNEQLQSAENVLSRKEKDPVDYESDPISEVCTCARRGADAIQRWLLSIDTENSSNPILMKEGPLDQDRMMMIVQEMDSKIGEFMKVFKTHSVYQSKN